MATHRTNASIEWPRGTLHGHSNERFSHSKRTQRRIATRDEFGVEVIRPSDPHYVPQYEPDNPQNVRHYPPSQYHPDDLDLLGEEDITPGEFWRRRRELRRVWEPIPATPLIIDFSDVKRPLFPSITPSWHSGSISREALEIYRPAIREARRLWPGQENRLKRDVHYWSKMDAGELPSDFNPYPEGTDRHAAFTARTLLVDDRPVDPETQRLETERQTRRRAERKLKRGMTITDEEFALIFRPVEQWTIEELSKGYCKTAEGRWPSRPPSQLMRGQIRERIDEEFRKRVRGSMNGLTVDALNALQRVIKDDDLDGRGRPMVPAATKVKAAEFLLDHLLGKPKQVVQEDISVRLSGILADVMVAPEAQLTPEGVVPTGRLMAGQRGVRGGHRDRALESVYQSTLGSTLAIENVVDAEVVDEDE